MEDIPKNYDNPNYYASLVIFQKSKNIVLRSVHSPMWLLWLCFYPNTIIYINIHWFITCKGNIINNQNSSQNCISDLRIHELFSHYSTWNLWLMHFGILKHTNGWIQFLIFYILHYKTTPFQDLEQIGKQDLFTSQMNVLINLL